MIKRLVFVLVVLVIIQSLTFPVFASAGGGGLADLGGFFSWIGRLISDGFRYLIEGLKSLFIPRSGFFTLWFDSLSHRFNEKFGSIFSVVQYFRLAFENIRPYTGGDNTFILKFPQDHLLGNLKIDLFKDSRDFIYYVRYAFTGLLAIITFAFCIRRFVSIVNT